MASSAPSGGASGRSLAAALVDKYEDVSSKSGMVIVGKRHKGMVPPNVVMHDQSITSIGDLAPLGADIRDLDMSKNQVEAWEEVASLLQQQPKLRLLNLSRNPLAGAIDTPLVATALSVLVLNHTAMPWRDVCTVTTHLPALAELHLQHNGYTQVDVPASGLPSKSLKALHLNHNSITEWREALKLNCGVSTLVLTGSPVQGIAAAAAAAAAAGGGGGAGAGAGAGSTASSSSSSSSTDVAAATSAIEAALPNLSTLYVSDSALSSWADIDALGGLTSLHELRIKNIPIVLNVADEAPKGVNFASQDDAQLYARKLLIARLPHVTKLNGSQISASERSSAERAFIRHYRYAGPDGAELPASSPLLPPRYKELVDVHGLLAKLADVNLEPPKFADVLVVAALGDGSDRSEPLRVDLRQTVLQLRTALAKRLHVSGGAGAIKLQYRDRVLIEVWKAKKKRDRVVEPFCFMASGERSVGSYQVHDGDEIHVLPADHPKDFPAPDPKHQLNTEGEVTLVLRLPGDEPALKFTVATKASVGDLAEYVGGILETDKAFSMELLQTKTKQRTQLKHGARKLYMYRVEDWDEVHVALRKEE